MINLQCSNINLTLQIKSQKKPQKEAFNIYFVRILLLNHRYNSND